MKTVACSSCNTVNADATPQSVCTNCSEPLAGALLQQSIDGLREATERMKELTAPRKSFYSFNGFGTTLLDYRALPDGTYEATRWVIAMLLPIFPLKAYIIRPTEQQISYGQETSRFTILGETRLSAARVLRTYLLAVIGLLPVVVGFLNSSAINRALSGLMAFGLMILCIVWAVYIIAFKIKNEGQAYKAKVADKATA